MSKGLEALERVKNHSSVSVDYFYEHFGEDLDIIEKELKQAKENEEMLNVFKNALTIERKPANNIHAFKKDRENCISSFVSEIIEIKQNELNNKLCSNLREWALKNAFPKELKALEIIKKKDVHKTMLSLTQNADEYNHFIDDVSEEMQLTQEEYDLLKEVLL